MEFVEFVLRARDWVDGSYLVEVTSSPVDRTRQPFSVSYAADLPGGLRMLERKALKSDDLVALGKTLAGMLLPGGVREMLLASLARLGPREGLRLRLVLDDPRLANIPWEYTYLPAGFEEAAPYGFLALDPRISIVRHESLPMAPASPRSELPLKLVVGMASPRGMPKLDLQAERQGIEAALTGVDGVEVTYIDALTVGLLEDACQGAHIFHFAGHGAFFWERGDEAFGSGVVFLSGEDGGKVPFPVHNLALALRGAGVRVAFLGGCETGRRDGVNPWSGVAPAMMRAGLPAAVGMQYSVYDRTAIAFTRRFYRALASGLSLDEAVTLGRLGMYTEEGEAGVDWGVPVLYLRSSDGLLFPEATHDYALEEARRRQRLEVKQRVSRLSGQLLGAAVEQESPWWLEVAQEIDVVESGAEVLGVRLGSGVHGDCSAVQEVKTVRRGAQVVGVSVASGRNGIRRDVDSTANAAQASLSRDELGF
jgi:hypothetical protein